MTTLFEGEIISGDLVASLRDAYEAKLLLNPPTPAFMETNPKREMAARYAAKRDVDRLLAVLEDLGLMVVRKEGNDYAIGL